MTAVGESDSTLATKCLDLCQTLAGQGLAFNFSLKISSSFSFSLETRDKGLASDTPGKIKKKPSPSTLRRNARRKEAFLKRKQNPAPVSAEGGVEPEVGLPQQEEDAFKCDICGNTFKSDNGLRIHKGKSHKSHEFPQRERMRAPDSVNFKHVSPLKDVREEVTTLQVFKCEAFDSMNHACEEEFESEDTLDDHLEIHGECVGCPGCKHLFYDCDAYLDGDEASACPGCSTPWPKWRGPR